MVIGIFHFQRKSVYPVPGKSAHVGAVTPFGGVALIAGWLAFAGRIQAGPLIDGFLDHHLGRE